jgi:anti-sigma-K factor RskA
MSDRGHAHDDLRTLVPLHALDALDAADSAAAEEHLSTCAECRRALDEALETAAALAFSVPPVAPPPALRERVLEAARTERARSEAPAPRAPAMRPRRSFRALLAPARALAVAMTLLALVLGGIAISARRDAADLRAARARDAAAIAALQSPGARVVAVQTPGRSVAAAVVLGRAARPVLVTELSKAPPLHVYQVWAILADGSKPISIGLIGGGRDQVVRLSRTLPAGTTIALTVEPAGGSPQPTTKPFATGGLG